MNLQKLFEAQKKLDDHIEKNKGLEGKNLLDKKILALQVELGELANEWRGFKYWSENQEPNGEELCSKCNGSGYVINQYDLNEMDCSKCGGTSYENPLLEEYVDGFHFILGIGNDLNITHIDEAWISEMGDYSEESTTETFIKLIDSASSVYLYEDDINVQERIYEELFLTFIALGLEERHLGFTWEQIEQAYFAKNKVNHERQEQGY